MALTITPLDDFGKSCPEFSLPATDGNIYSSGDLKTGMPFVVMFICNHCPYVQAIEDRLILLGRELKSLDISLLAICSNDSESHPEDSFKNLKLRAEQKDYSFPYLYDETQQVAKAFGAVCTPDFFVYDSNHKLAYRGRLDDSWKDANKVTTRELYDAVVTLKNNQTITNPQTPSMGCSIKWI